MMTNFADPDAYAVDGRGVAYSMAYFSAKHLGTGQYYLMTIRDKERKPLDGGSTYRLNVPANAPVKLYWSATAYDRATHALIRDMPHGRAAPPTRPACRRTPTVRWTSTSDPRRPTARSPTGFRPTRTAGSRCCSASTAPRSRSSTRRGCCRTSSASHSELKRGCHEKSSHSNLRWLAARGGHAALAQAPPATVGRRCRPGHRRQLQPRRDRHGTSPASWQQGGFGKFYHHRELPPSTAASSCVPTATRFIRTAVFDLDAGPVTITLPDAGKRFMSMIVIDEDHYVARRSSTAPADTPSPRSRSARATSWRRSARWSIRTIRRT